MNAEQGGSRAARRSAILSRFVTEWGEPELHTTVERNDDVIDVYGFPPRGERGVFRAVTVGASEVKRKNGELAGFELMMVLPRDLGGATFKQVSSLMLDVMVYGLTSQTPLRIGYTFTPSPHIPSDWSARSLLLDEPAGEPEDLATFHVDGLHIELLWIVPIYDSEREGIQQKGLEWFYDLEEESEWSLADPHRPPFVE